MLLARLAPLRALSTASSRSLASATATRAPLQVLDSIEGFRAARRALPASATLGLVPTMGVRVLDGWTSVFSPACLGGHGGSNRVSVV